MPGLATSAATIDITSRLPQHRSLTGNIVHLPSWRTGARMLPTQRRQAIITQVREQAAVSAEELSGRDGIELLLSGGQVRPGDGACSGAHAEAFFAEFYADRAFLGSGGLHPVAGLTDYYPAEVVVRRTIVAHTAKNYVLADSSKLGVIAVRRVCELNQLTAILTDDAENHAAAEALAAEEVPLMRAAVAGRQLPAAG